MNYLLPLLLSAGATSAFTVFTHWQVGPDYAVKFDGRGAAGTFTGLRGTIDFDPRDPAAGRIDVTVDVATISTGNATKDRHARGEGWFDAERYPTIRFRSTAIGEGTESYTMIGELTLHGTTREVRFPFTFTPRDAGGVFEGSFTVKRKDYGIEGTFGQFAVSNEFAVQLRIPVE